MERSKGSKVPRTSSRQTSVSDVPKSKKVETSGASTEKRKLPRAKTDVAKDQGEANSSDRAAPVKPASKSRVGRATASVKQAGSSAPSEPELLRLNSRDPRINRRYSSQRARRQYPVRANTSELRIHIEEDKDEEEDSESEVDSDDYDFRGINYDRFNRYCGDRKYDCWKCGEICIGKKELYKHQNFLCCLCQYCGDQFDGLDELDKHRKEAHESKEK